MTLSAQQKRVVEALRRFAETQRRRADDRAPGRRTRLARAIVDELPIAGRTVLLPPDQLALVLVLEERGALSVGELEESLGLSQAGTSELVQRAENLGRVCRIVDARDHRVHIVALTPKAVRERERARAAQAAPQNKPETGGSEK